MSVIVRLPQGGGGADTSVVTAGAGDVLSGKVIVNSAGSSVTGTMANNGAVSQSLNAGGSYTIPAGYHNGSGKVTANSLASQTDGTAYPGQILDGKTAYVDGSKVTGTMPNNGAVTGSVNAGGTYTIPAGYHNGSGTVTGNSLASQTAGSAAAGDILKDKIAWVAGSKVTGTMTNNGAVTGSVNAGGTYTIPAGYHNGSGKVTGNALSGQTAGTATAAHILSGKTAWVAGSQLTGTMTNRGTVTQTLNAGGSYTIPAGYHSGSGTVTANSLSSQTSGTATAADILSGKTAWVGGTKLTGTLASGTGTGKYIKTTQTLSLNQIKGDSNYPNLVTLYQTTFSCPDACGVITSGKKYFAIVNIIFTKSVTSHYGGSSYCYTNGTFPTKFFFVYDGSTTYVYDYVDTLSISNKTLTYGSSPGTCNTRVTNMTTDSRGYNWKWNGSNKDPHLIFRNSYPGSTYIPTTVTTDGSVGGSYHVTVANVSAQAVYEIFTY